MCITSQAQCRCPMLRQAGRSTSQPDVIALVSMAKHPAKDAAKFRRNFIRVELPSRKFHRNSTANFTAIKSQTHQAQ